jgi:hypothetical protein
MGKLTWTKLSEEKPQIGESVLVLIALEVIDPKGKSIEVCPVRCKYIQIGDQFSWEDKGSLILFTTHGDQYWVSDPPIPEEIRLEVLTDVHGTMPGIIEMRD